MSDTRIIITDRRGLVITSDPNYSSYTFHSEVFSISDSFELVLADNTVDISNWYGVQLRVNDITVFDGTVQRSNRILSPGSREIILSGKDRGKFLEESFCNKFQDFKDASPESIVNALIDQTPFYPQGVANYQSVVAEPDWDDPQEIADFNTALINDIKDNKAFLKSNNKTIFDSNFTSLGNKKLFKIEHGDLVGDKLVDLVRSVGMDIFYQQDGSLFFGLLDNLRDSTSKRHTLSLNEDDRGNNVLEVDIVEDDSGRYSDITVISQNQNGVNTTATATDVNVVDKKSMVLTINDDEISPEKEAIRIRNDQLVESFLATYTVSDHIEDGTGEPWTLNRNTRIADEINNVIGNFVLYSVTYTFDRDEGRKTILSLSHPRDSRLVV